MATKTGTSGNNSISGTNGIDTLFGRAGNDTLLGLLGNDRLFGEDGIDRLVGSGGIDRLDGGTGNDRLEGGADNDVYIVDSTADLVVEAANAGTDLVQSKVSHTLRVNVENLTLTGTAKINGTGNTLANTIVGNAGINTLNGSTGNDKLVGGLGNDRLLGGTGNDSLDGGSGNDRMEGSTGNDVYVANATGDLIVEGLGAGTDTVLSSTSRTLAANVENLTLTGTAAINGTGNTLANTIVGNAGINTLNGSSGNDKLVGGSGNDRLIGGTGNDSLDGGTGNDRMEGGTGNDTFVVNSTTDVVVELSGQGTDTIRTSVALAAIPNHVEAVVFLGAVAANLAGNSAANTITGSSGVNLLDGQGGNDRLFGVGGNDTLLGGDGNDSLDGGTGNDTLAGGAGIDTLTGGSGNDRLDGAAGADFMAGGTGSDLYILDDAADLVIEALPPAAPSPPPAGDLVPPAGLLLAPGAPPPPSAADDLATDVDRIEVPDEADPAFDLVVPVGIEVATLLGTADRDVSIDAAVASGVTIFGNAGINTITGGAGNDRIEGGGGADSFAGGDGDDTYVVDSIDDVVAENADEGDDTIVIATDVDLNDLANVENVTLQGDDDLDIIGDGADNILVGTPGANTILGNAGDDTLQGQDGADSLAGGEGNDRVEGGTGLDRAVFAGNRADYLIESNVGTTVTDLDGAADGDDGVDTVAGVEVLVFADGTAIAPVDLGELDIAVGFKIVGENVYDSAGSAVAEAGDLNGDGFGDIVIGAFGADAGGNQSGAAYVVFGKATGFGTVNLDDIAAGVGGFKLFGENPNDGVGRAFSAAGDVNGDGFGDLLVGAPYNPAVNNGAAYVIFGKAGGFATVNLDTIAVGSPAGFKIEAEAANDRAAISVAAGDFNGDGFSDLVIGAQENDADGVNSGAAYVVFGQATGLGNVDLTSVAEGDGGFKILGENAGDLLATRNAASVGDINGDGLADVVLGARNADPAGYSSGAAYVVFGKTNQDGTIDLDNVASGDGGFKIVGEDLGDQAGIGVAAAGDINGDGFVDVLVGANGDNDGGPQAGAAYLIFGTAAGLTTVDLTDIAAGVGGFKITGEGEGEFAGEVVAAAGDMNGDGLDDLVIGAYGNNGGGSNSGAVYVVFGKADGFGTIDLRDIVQGVGGFKVSGENAGDFIGRTALSAAGDVDGDGFDDVIVGAYLHDQPGATNIGAGYVLFGRDFDGTVTDAGTTGADNLVGTGANETFIGGQGDDTLDGGGGNDVLKGGAGDDRIVFDAADQLRIDGGGGTDTLVVQGTGVSLDLTTVNVTAHYTLLNGIEAIDIGGSGANTLTLGLRDLLALSDHSNVLRIDGGADDAVVAGGGWIQDANTTIGAQTYAVYTQGGATLLVDTDIDAAGIDVAGFDLAAMEDVGGFRMVGEVAGDGAGYAVAMIGDINGDGFDDLAVGAHAGPASAGAAYVVFGKATGFVDIDLGDIAAGSGGFKILGENANDLAGLPLSALGDVNGDGFDDFLVGAVEGDAGGTASGAAYVIFGKATAFGTVNLDDVALGTGGFKLFGENPSDFLGFATVSAGGDLNGDGFSDVVIGASRNDNAVGTDAGAIYVVFGKASGFATVNLDSIAAGVGGFKIVGQVALDRAGNSVSLAGDINGDGFDDLIVSGDRNDANGTDSGAAYVVFGKADGFAAVGLASVASGVGGFKITGETGGDAAGYAVDAIGDFNGDGFDDLVVSGLGNDAGGSNAGAAYVVFGAAGLAAVNLSDIASGVGGFKIVGQDAGDFAGNAVAGAGDVNGDGLADVLVAAYGHGQEGAAYIVFGTATPPTGIDLDDVAKGQGGIKLIGEAANDFAGNAIDGGRDVNGDGFDDVVIGAYQNDAAGNVAGSGYVLLGRDFDGVVTDAGTAGADNLVGTGGADILLGGQGNDTLDGGAGNDVLKGGAGDDRIVFNAADGRLVDGGLGTDTLVVQGAGVTLDLTAINATAHYNLFQGIERIDLTGSGDNVIAFDFADIRNLSSTHTLFRIDANAGDTVAGGGGWTQLANTVVGAQTYAVYMQGAVTLQVDVDADRSLVDVATLHLDGLTDFGGFRLIGETGPDQLGLSIAGLGDVNGDGFADYALGAGFADFEGNATGAAYVVFGKAGGFADLDMEDIANGDGSAGFKVLGENAEDLLGFFGLSSAGDLDDDGFDDVLVSALGNDSGGSTNNGASYVIFGKAAGFATVNLDDVANDVGGFKIAGQNSFDRAGIGASSAGDFNADGFDDLVIGAYGNFAGVSYAGAAYVIFGKAGGFTGIDLEDVTNGAGGGFKILGQDVQDRAGRSVHGAGDVNGDGFDDVIVGSRYNDAGGTDGGAAYVVFGKAAGFTDIDLDAVAAGTGGFKIVGEAAGDAAGIQVSTAGDMNGDGFDDLLVGAFRNDAGGGNAGAAYVVLGKAGGFGTINLDDVAAGTGGFKLTGEFADDETGYGLGAAGDVNGDGFDDIIVGARYNDAGGNAAGASYVVFGAGSGLASLDLADVAKGIGGFKIVGENANDTMGQTATGAGDIDGDSFDDILIGADEASNGVGFGVGYILFGRDFGHVVTDAGTAGADTLAGTGGDDILVGGRGDDTLDGGAGNDVLKGGQGDDRLVFDADDALAVDGGLGEDTLVVGGAGATLDLTDLNADAHYALIEGVEAVDITGSGDNALALDVQDLLHLSGTSNALRVDGDAGDTVATADAGWGAGVADADIVGYTSYTNGQAVLVVDSSIDRTGIQV